MTDETVAELQHDDPVLGPVSSWLKAKYEPSLDELKELQPEGRRLWSMNVSLQIVNNVLVRKTDREYQLLVSDVLKRRLFEHVHAGPLSAHLGADRTLAQLRANYYWSGIASDVRSWCTSCDVCARSKGAPPRAHAPMEKVTAAAPMDLVAIDILSGLPTASDGSTYMLVVTDYMTKWTEAYPLPNEEASTCMTALYNNFFSRFGLPTQLHSDQGRNF